MPQAVVRGFLITSKVSDVSRRSRTLSGSAASQIPLLYAGGATEGNATDDALMVDQGGSLPVDTIRSNLYTSSSGQCFRMTILFGFQGPGGDCRRGISDPGMNGIVAGPSMDL
jgi:hypothetical protein